MAIVGVRQHARCCVNRHESLPATKRGIILPRRPASLFHSWRVLSDMPVSIATRGRTYRKQLSTCRCKR